MRSSPQKKQHARDLYLHTPLTQQQIANIVSVDRRTVYTWIRDEHWEELKIAARRTPMHLTHNVYNHIDRVEEKIRQRPVEDRCPTMEEIEMLRKLYNMMAMTGNIRYIGNYVETYEHLLRYIDKKDHDLCARVAEYADEVLTAHCLDQEWDLREDQEYMNEKLDRLAEEKRIRDSDNIDNPIQANDTPVSAAGKTDKSTQWDNNEILGNDKKCPPDSVTGAPHEELGNVNEPPEYPISGFSADGNTTGVPTGPQLSVTVKYYASLPPDQRPSPFRDGDTLWVNDIDDLDRKFNTLGQPWGEQKMGDRIRRYSEIK